MDVEQGFQLTDLGSVVRRRLATFAGVAGSLSLIAIVVVLVLADEYEASSMLMIEPQTISKRLIEAGLEESDVNNRLHLMTAELLSRGRLSRIIDDLTLYEDESEEMTREEVIALMRDDLRVEPVFPELEQDMDLRFREMEINTFRIFYRSHDAKTAAAVTNRLANDFIEKHIQERVKQSGDTTEFIEAERERLSARISEVEQRIAAVKAENIGRLPEDLESNQRIMERTHDNLRMAQRDLAIAESDEAFFRQQAAAGGVDEPGASASNRPEVRLQELELLLASYQSRGLTDKHPDVVATRSEMDVLRAQLADEGGEDGEHARVLSPGQQSAQAEARRAALRVASSRAEIERLENNLALFQRFLSETPRVAEQLAGLEREYQHLFETYQDVSTKSQEAAVAADMERRQKGEQFRILESAFPPPEPAWPNRWLLSALGVLLGLVAGVIAAALTEASDASFHVSRDLQAEFDLPVLASIPAIVLDADRRRVRRQRVRRSFALAALVTFVLVGGVAGNWWMNGVPGPVQKLLGWQEAAPAPGAPPQT